MTASAAQDVESEQPGRVTLTATLLVRRYVEQGVAARQIADETGWSEHYVRARLREHGIATRPRGTVKNRPLDRGTLADWLAQGQTVAQIAARAGYSPSGIYVLMRRWQLSVPTPRPAAAKPAPRGELETVARLYRDERLSLADVGEAFGHGADWARARVLAAGVALRHVGVQPGSSNDQYARLDADQVARWYADGLTTKQIARRTGRSPAAVSATLKAAGVDVRGGPRRTGPDPDPAQARELYVEQRMTVKQVAAHLGCSAERAAAVLRADGVELRPARERTETAPLPPIDPAQLRELYLTEQLTLAQIAARVGGSEFRIAAALDKLGIARRATGPGPVPPLDLDAATLQRLYVTERLDDQAIGARYGVPAYRVTLRRRELMIARPAVRPPSRVPPAPPSSDVLRRLYLQEHTPIAVIAHRFGTSTPTARAWLLDAGIPIQPRTTRAHRVLLDPAVLRELYTEREWTAAEIAAELNTSHLKVLRALHDHAIPVRRGGSRRTQRLPGEPPATRLLAALYADRQVSAALRRHGVPRRPQPGPIADRFPTAVGLTRALLVELYEGVGLSARHIELLTGQPHEQILDALHAHSIGVRRDLGHSPWLARQP